MNIKQKIVIVIGIFLVIMNCLFLPYEGEYRVEGDNFKVYLGYHFLFTPPTKREVSQAFWGRQEYLHRFSSYIITSRIWIQEVTILIVFSSALILLGRKTKRTDSDN